MKRNLRRIEPKTRRPHCEEQGDTTCVSRGQGASELDTTTKVRGVRASGRSSACPPRRFFLDSRNLAGKKSARRPSDSRALLAFHRGMQRARAKTPLKHEMVVIALSFAQQLKRYLFSAHSRGAHARDRWRFVGSNQYFAKYSAASKFRNLLFLTDRNTLKRHRLPLTSYEFSLWERGKPGAKQFSSQIGARSFRLCFIVLIRENWSYLIGYNAESSFSLIPPGISSCGRRLWAHNSETHTT